MDSSSDCIDSSHLKNAWIRLSAQWWHIRRDSSTSQLLSLLLNIQVNKSRQVIGKKATIWTHAAQAAEVHSLLPGPLGVCASGSRKTASDWLPFIASPFGGSMEACKTQETQEGCQSLSRAHSDLAQACLLLSSKV